MLELNLRTKTVNRTFDNDKMVSVAFYDRDDEKREVYRIDPLSWCVALDIQTHQLNEKCVLKIDMKSGKRIVYPQGDFKVVWNT